MPAPAFLACCVLQVPGRRAPGRDIAHQNP